MCILSELMNVLIFWLVISACVHVCFYTKCVILVSDQLNGSDDDFSSDDDDDDSEEEYRYQNIYPDKLKLKQSIKKSKLGMYKFYFSIKH